MSIGGTCPGVIMANPCIKRGTECFWNFLIRFLLPLECVKMMIKESDISLDQDRGAPSAHCPLQCQLCGPGKRILM